METEQDNKIEVEVEQQIIETAKWNNKYSRKKKQVIHPSHRYNHSAVVYQDYMYLFGGVKSDREKPSSKIEQQSRQNTLRMALNTLQWQQIKSDWLPPMLNSHGCVVWKDNMLIFGGSDNNKRCSNELYSFDLINHQWSKIQVKSNSCIPSPRQSAFVHILKNDYLIVLGGLCNQPMQIFTDIFLLDLNLKEWKQITTQGADYYLNSVTLQSSCMIKQTIYLFGGLTISTETNFSQQLYSVNIDPEKLTAIFTKITSKSSYIPSPRCSHCMLTTTEGKFVIIGGQGYNEEEQQQDQDVEQNQISKTQSEQEGIFIKNDVWIFDTALATWTKVLPHSGIFKGRAAFSAVYKNQTIYIFGGIKNYSFSYDDLVLLEFQQEEIPQVIPEPQCSQCAEHNKKLLQQNVELLSSTELSMEFLLSISNLIKFPFAAIGLLVDNAVMTQATTINISVIDFQQNPVSENTQIEAENNNQILQQQNSNQINPNQRNSPPILNEIRGPDKVARYIVIEDDGKPWNNEQFLQIILKYQVTNFLEFQLNDKKAKANIFRENSKRQFGNNIKIGSLRLGLGFLYLSYFQNYIRVALFTTKKKSSDQMTYICYYYIEEISNISEQGKPAKFLTKQGQQNKTLIMNFSERILKPKALSEIQQNNQLYIFDMRDIATAQGIFYQLNPHKNDLINDNLVKIDFLDKMGYMIYECPDISLRSYLSLLYLKIQCKIYLKTGKNEKQEIINQMFLDRIDRQKNVGLLKQIEHLSDYPQIADCKVVELYYNPFMQKKSNLFHSGILFYQKNRLIFRYKYQLGLIFQHKFYKSHYKKNCENNVFQFFGFIELPDGITSNFLKTDVTNRLLLEGLFSNLKHVIKDIKRKLKRPEIPLIPRMSRYKPKLPLPKNTTSTLNKQEQDSKGKQQDNISNINKESQQQGSKSENKQNMVIESVQNLEESSSESLDEQIAKEQQIKDLEQDKIQEEKNVGEGQQQEELSANNKNSSKQDQESEIDEIDERDNGKRSYQERQQSQQSQEPQNIQQEQLQQKQQQQQQQQKQKQQEAVREKSQAMEIQSDIELKSKKIPQVNQKIQGEVEQAQKINKVQQKQHGQSQAQPNSLDSVKKKIKFQ